MSIRALSGLKEKCWRVTLERAELTRLASMLDTIRPELALYQKTLAEQWQANQSAGQQIGQYSGNPEISSEALKLFYCFESLLSALDQFVQLGISEEEKNGRARLTLTEEESTKLRVINYCARHLPNLPESIAWLEFAHALVPVLAALDRSAFEQLSSLVIPKPVTCTVDDLKRGRDLLIEPDKPADSPTPEKEKTEGFDLNT